MRAAAVVLSVGALLGWVSFLLTQPITIPMVERDTIEAGRTLGVAALTLLSLVAVAALLATRRA